MATFYIDPSAAVNGSGTESSPYNVIPGTLVAGNEYLYKRGTTFTPSAATQAIQIGQSGTAGARITVGAYGSGDLPVINCANTTRGVNISTDVGHITVQDLRITNVAANTSRRGITNATTGSSSTVDTSIIIQNVQIDNVLTDGANDCDGIQLWGANNKILFCLIYDISDDGIWYKGDNIEIAHNTVRTVASSGRVAGDCIQAGGAADNGWIHDNILDHTNDTTKQCYIHNTTSTGLLFERNTCTGPSSGAAFTTALFSAITGLIVRHNRFLGGANCHISPSSNGALIEGNLLVNSYGRGVDMNADDVLVYGNTVVGVLAANIYGLRHTDIGHTGCVAKNNMMIGWDRGIQATTGCAASYNGYWQNTTNINGIISGGNDVTSDPLLTASYKPRQGSPLLGAGTHLGYTRDIERKQRSNPPSIGAYDYATLRTPY